VLESSVDDPVKLMNGKLVTELQSLITTLQASKTEQRERIDRKQAAMEETKERLNKLKRETEMLQVGRQASTSETSHISY
jgi:predicted nuclease with TOPRIM domain